MFLFQYLLIHYTVLKCDDALIGCSFRWHKTNLKLFELHARFQNVYERMYKLGKGAVKI